MAAPLPPLENGQFGIVSATEIKLEKQKTTLRFERVDDQVVMHLSVTLEKNDNILLGHDQTNYPTPIGVFNFEGDNHLRDRSLPSFFLFTGDEDGEVVIQSARTVKLRTDGEKREHGEGLIDPEFVERLQEENHRLRQVLYDFTGDKQPAG